MLLYSLALAGRYDEHIFSRIISRQLPLVKSLTVTDPRSLSNMLWALAELGLEGKHPEVFDAVCKSTMENTHR
jgi:hypothetical protein